MENENEFKVKGVIYSKVMETITGVKDPTQSYQKVLITLEVKSRGYQKRGETEFYGGSTNLLQFECFNPRFEVDDFYKDGIVEIAFFIEGKEYIRKKGDRIGEKGLFNKNVITAIKMLDKEGTRDNKIPVTAMSDIDTIGEPPKEKDVFSGEGTNMVPPIVDDDIDNDPLPF